LFAVSLVDLWMNSVCMTRRVLSYHIFPQRAQGRWYSPQMVQRRLLRHLCHCSREKN